MMSRKGLKEAETGIDLDHPHRGHQPSPGGDGWHFCPAAASGERPSFSRSPPSTPSAWAHASKLLAPSLEKLCDAVATRSAVGSSTGRRPPRGGAPLRPPTLGPPPPPSAARLVVAPQCRSSSWTRSGTGRRPLQDELAHAVRIRRICALGPPPGARTRCVAGEGTSDPPPRLPPPRPEIHAPPPPRDWIGRPPRHRAPASSYCATPSSASLSPSARGRRLTCASAARRQWRKPTHTTMSPLSEVASYRS
jgi:hypothetical protein